MFNLQQLWYDALQNFHEKNAIADRRFGRAMGKRIVVKVQRARAKRIAKGRTPYQLS